jgi:hypothetical protein
MDEKEKNLTPRRKERNERRESIFSVFFAIFASWREVPLFSASLTRVIIL